MSANRKSHQAASCRKARLDFEQLENRLTPSVTLVNGDIQIVQTGGNDTANVSLVAGTYRVVDNGLTTSFTTAQVSGGDVYYYGRAGDDNFANLTNLRTSAWGEAGDDSLRGGGGDNWLYGGDRNDRLFGGGRVDRLFGESGDDRLAGDAGDDWLYGGTGNDTLYGEHGLDRLYGEGDQDWLSGGDHADLLDGGAGNDTLAGGNYDDWLYGGTGIDTLYGEHGLDRLYGEGDQDWLFGGDHADLLDGGAGNDTLAAGEGDDSLQGGDGDDTLYGETGHDTLFGGRGQDWLDGGAHKDGLFGGAGVDVLNGGTEADRFLLTRDGDRVVDLDPRQDATIEFIVGAADIVAGVSRPSQAWTDREIERVDAALAVLHYGARDAELLKTSSDGVIRFARHGGIGRGNNQNGTVHLTSGQVPNDASTDSTAENYLRGYVLHEVGHNWNGNQLGGSFWTSFQNKSNWITWNPNNPAFAKAAEQDAWYRTSSEFVSSYARNTINDDWAESFAAYFMDKAGWTFYLTNPSGTSGAAAAPNKMALIGQWVATV